jgi:hypothetical protein
LGKRLEKKPLSKQSNESGTIKNYTYVIKEIHNEATEKYHYTPNKNSKNQKSKYCKNQNTEHSNCWLPHEATEFLIYC